MKIQNDILGYAQILNEAADDKAHYEDACNEFEKHRNDLDDEVDEAAIVVDDTYIKKASYALEPLKAKNKKAYDAAMKYLNYQHGRQLAVSPEMFAKNRIARANAQAGAAEVTTTSTPDSRWELMQKVAADKKAERDQAALDKSNSAVTPNEITITDVKMQDSKTCLVTFDIKWSDGKADDGNTFSCPIDDYEFIKAKRMMGARANESAAVALLQQSYDSRASKPIKWMFYNKKTGVKTDGAKFTDVVIAKKRISKKVPAAIDPAKEKAYELAAGYNKQFGSVNLRYTVK